MLSAISNIKLNNIFFKGNHTEKNNTPRPQTEEDIFDGYTLEEFIDNSIQDMLSQGFDLGDVGEFKRKLRLEADLVRYFALLSNKEVAKLIRQVATNKKMDLKTFNSIMTRTAPLIDMNEIDKTFASAGINSLRQAEDCAKIISRNKSATAPLYSKYEEAVHIYGLLKSKEDLANFPELLIELYKDEENSFNPNFAIINEYCEFLKAEGIQNFNHVETSLAHLSEYFENFETPQDKIEAIKYAYSEYQDKLELTAQIYEANPLTKEGVKVLYKENKDIISYVYNSGSEEELDNLVEIKDYLANRKKVKFPQGSELGKHFNDFKTPQDKIDFYLFLKDCNISSTDYASLGKNSVTNIGITKKILNKSAIIEKLQSMTDWSEQKINDFYKTNNEILTLGAIMQEQDPSSDSFLLVFNFINKFNIKNPTSLLNQYNTFYRTKEKTLTAEKTLAFLELTKFIGNGNIVEDSRKMNMSSAALLQSRKEKFEAIEKDIQTFLDETDNECFVSMTALDVYNKYRELFGLNSNVKDVLENITFLETENIEQFQQQTQAIEPFVEFFDNKKELLSFFKANQIKLDNTKEEALYRDMCYEIIAQLRQNSMFDNEEFKNKLQQLTKNKVLKSSKSQCEVFKKDLSCRKDFPQIVEILCKKDIKTIKNLATFLTKTQDINGDTQNVTEALLNSPDEINLENFKKIIKNIQKTATRFGIKATVNNENISNLDISKYQKISTSFDGLNNLFGKLLNEKCDNFLPLTINGTTRKPKTFSSYEIASELMTKQDHVDSAYQNIKDVLGINVDLQNEDASLKYQYISMIAKRLPKEFIEFVNSPSWHTLENGKIANLNLHAKLRTIGRFALDENSELSDLYNPKTKEKLQNLFNTVYLEKATDIKEITDFQNRYMTVSKFENDIIEAIFTPQGELITIYPKV